MDEFLDSLQSIMDSVMAAGASLGQTSGLVVALSVTVILVWLVGRFLRL